MQITPEIAMNKNSEIARMELMNFTQHTVVVVSDATAAQWQTSCKLHMIIGRGSNLPREFSTKIRILEFYHFIAISLLVFCDVEFCWNLQLLNSASSNRAMSLRLLA